jgi:hypothetical protein
MQVGGWSEDIMASSPLHLQAPGAGVMPSYGQRGLGSHCDLNWLRLELAQLRTDIAPYLQSQFARGRRPNLTISAFEGRSLQRSRDYEQGGSHLERWRSAAKSGEDSKGTWQ